MPYQGLRDRCVHTVHGHMVAVVGRPTESKLAQVTCADHHSAHLICDIHKHFCTLSRLTILEHNAVIIEIVTDIFIVL